MTGIQHTRSITTTFTPWTEDALVTRVRGEYREMPGMRLTVDQAMRLWMLDRQTCSRVLDSLVEAHFLSQDRSGRYLMAHSDY